jgi:hypothetical protein
MGSYKKAAAIGGTVVGGGTLSFFAGIAAEAGTIGCIALGPAGAVVAAGVGIGAGLGCVAKLIFD